MKAHIVTLASVILAVGAGAAYAANETVTLNALEANGVGKEIGTLRLSDTKEGLEIMPGLAGLPPGDHGLHVHVNPNCGPGNGPNGQPAAGMAAGGHYDPANTGKHLGPHGEGHKGDLPALTVDAVGSNWMRGIWCRTANQMRRSSKFIVQAFATAAHVHCERPVSAQTLSAGRSS